MQSFGLDASPGLLSADLNVPPFVATLPRLTTGDIHCNRRPSFFAELVRVTCLYFGSFVNDVLEQVSFIAPPLREVRSHGVTRQKKVVDFETFIFTDDIALKDYDVFEKR